VHLKKLTYTKMHMLNAKSAGALLSISLLFTAIVAIPFELTVAPRVVEAKSAAQTLKELQAQQAQKEAAAAAQKKIKDAADAKVKELSGQITQVAQNIQKTQGDIVTTSDQIDTKNQSIAGLESQLRETKDKLETFLRQMYMQRASMPDSLELFSDQPVSEREKQQAQFAALKKAASALYVQTTAAQQQVQNERNDLVSRSQNLSNLKDQQAAQKDGLASYQQTQAQLKINAEATLKDLNDQLLKIYQAEASAQKAIDAAVAAGLLGHGVGPGVGTRVAAGTVIGYEGTSGFSTGYHVHQEVRVNNVPVNPVPYINNGTMDWALKSFEITQPFGKTSFSYVYAGGIHTGVDIAAPAGSPVYAPADGTVIVNSCPQGCGVGYGHLWAEQLDNGMVVMTGHLK
jgi:septal ring factor EnvC (AmiA/AmiB activator)